MPVCVRCGRLFFGGNCSSFVKNWLQMAGTAASNFLWQILVAARFSQRFVSRSSSTLVFLNCQRIDRKFTMMYLVKSRFDRSPQG